MVALIKYRALGPTAGSLGKPVGNPPPPGLRPTLPSVWAYSTFPLGLLYLSSRPILPSLLPYSTFHLGLHYLPSRPALPFL